MIGENPFRVDNPRAYATWRARKLAAYPQSVEELRVDVADLAHPSMAERSAIAAVCRRANMAIFRAAPSAGDNADNKSAIRAFGRAFGLDRLDANLYADDDGITALQVSDVERKRDFIPYTNQRLNWHTDGYYNTPDRQIRGLVMFCARAAAEGGENQLLDHEIAYILLRDAEPRFIEALMHPEAMTIPANFDQGVEIRPAETGPVFMIEPGTGNLHMRYSARLRNIEWRDDPMTLAAAEFLQNLWEEGCDYVYHYRLMPGEGIICNNVLHNRSAFRDDPASGKNRLIYRARYFDRIAATNFPDTNFSDEPGDTERMLWLSEILLQEHELVSFDQLIVSVKRRASDGEVFFRIDVKPPFNDTPVDWEDRLEAAFSTATR